ncbi:hypothetical protein LWI29_003181 [Acer saccharum]|uniref:CDC20/Fizzy WD40 domain-containing protein n=1 Tax=Acer saccharum TaxID=4024 RepID=A0AA39VPY5_ACESA|nr:hypothetical protein LWI29_003181 [Acer saccharum]
MDHERRLQRLVETDWYSPRRLLSSPIQYDFPGDRFIPNRSLMNLDQAHGLLTAKPKEYYNPKFNDAYRQKIAENLTLDSEGRPFRMLVFRGSPKSSRNSCRGIDEIRREDAEALKNTTKQSPRRKLPKQEARVLDAPDLIDNYYQKNLDWGNNNILAVALGSELYLWNSKNSNVQKLLQAVEEDNYPTSVAWSGSARNLVVGYANSKLELWDAETSKLVRTLKGHKRRVGTVSWNNCNSHVLTSGSLDKSIVNHDVRVSNNVTCRIRTHTAEVCGLKWSNEGNLLASGGNENLIHIWEPSKMSSSNYLHRFNDHSAAVKALAWCPHQFNICGLEWNRHHKEILSGHGFSESGNDNNNKLCLWEYPSMTKIGELKSHRSRVIELSQSTDGLTVVSAGADQTLTLWDVFGPPNNQESKVSYLDSLLSLKISPIR